MHRRGKCDLELAGGGKVRVSIYFGKPYVHFLTWAFLGHYPVYSLPLSKSQNQLKICTHLPGVADVGNATAIRHDVTREVELGSKDAVL